MSTTRSDPEALRVESLRALLARLEITSWDLLIVGDGSGSRWDRACGWASVLIERLSGSRRVFYGAANPGSVNYAECQPYFQALTWYDHHHGERRLREAGLLRVVVLTDSQVVANWGKAATTPGQPLPRPHAAVWAGFAEWRRLGYVFDFRWAPRESSGLNWAADQISRLSRLAVEQVSSVSDDLRTAAEDAVAGIQFQPATANIYGINPEQQLPKGVDNVSDRSV